MNQLINAKDGMLSNASTSSKHNDSDRKLYSREDCLSLGSWPSYNGNQLRKKHAKRRSSPKQLRIDLPDISVVSHAIKSCTVDKSRVIKHKHRQESKRSDRKSMRMSLKTKFDCFMSKDSMVNSHSGVNGNNICGPLGFNFDIHEIAKNVDEPSLSELLNGSYQCPNLCHDKIKRASGSNESILLSVRKAVSVLTIPSPGCSNSSGIAAELVPTDCDGGKYVKEQAFSNQVQDQATASDSALFRPMDTLERLALPAIQDLNSVIVETYSSLMPFKCKNKASLPPFPWSFSVGGSSKPSVDTKAATAKSTSQGKWVRIGNSSCLAGEEHSCFSELNMKMDDQSGQYLCEHLQSQGQMKLSDNLSYNVGNCMPQDANSIRKSSASDVSESNKPSEVLSSCEAFSPRAEKMNSSNVYLPGLKDPADVDMETEENFQCQKDESDVGNQSISNPKIQKISYFKDEDTEKDIDYSQKNCNHLSNGIVRGAKEYLSHSPIPGGSSSDHSPRLLAAAAILCDIAASTKKRDANAERTIWPNAPSQTAIKARKSKPFIGKTDVPKLAAKTTDPGRRVNRTTSPDRKPAVVDDKNKAICSASPRRGGPVRWSTSESTYARSGRDFAVKTAPSSPGRLPGGQAPPSTRAERGYDGHRKHRSPAVIAASVSTSSIYMKDWGKGRHRRE